jgi:hypothetical protein
MVGCEDGSSGPGELQFMAIEPGNLTLAQGTAERFKAVGYYEDGSIEDLTSEVQWTASGGNVTLTEGQVQGRSPGQVEVEAALDGISGTAAVEVTRATLSGLRMEEPEGSEGVLALGASQPYRLVGIFSDGSQQELTEQATFSLDNDLAIVSTKGVVTAQAPGEGIVTAHYGGFQAQSVVTSQTKSLSRISVTPSSVSFPKGLSQSFKAVGTYSDGTTKDLTSLATWRSSSSTACSVSSQGVGSGLRAGSATITATYGGRSGSAGVTVNTATLSSLSLTTGATLPVGTTQQLKLSARYSNSVSYDVTGFASFRSGSPTLASVTTSGTQRGLVKGLAVGSSVITASFGGRTVQTTVRVSAPSVTSLSLSLSTVQLPKGLTRQLTATAVFSDKTTRDVTNQATFSSSAPAVASVSTLTPRGVSTAKTLGSATITASYSGRSATCRVTVVNASLSSLRFEPANASLAAGTTQRFLVRGIYSDGSLQDVTANSALSIQNPALAELTSLRGEVRALSPGTTNLNASFGGKTASAALKVTPAVLIRIDVTPTSTSFPNGTEQQFTATGRYSDQTSQNVSLAAQWSAGNSSILDIDSGGRARGLQAGASSVTATLGAVSGMAQATVTPAVATRLTLEPAQASVPKGLTQSLVAMATFSDGTSRDVTHEAVYLSASPQVAEVSNGIEAGTVTALQLGDARITAAYSGQQATSSITVTPARVTSLRLEPAAASIAAGTTQSFLIRALMSDGTQRDVTSEGSLVAQDSAIAASTANTGEFLGTAPGQTRVVAHFGSQTASAELSVTPAVLVRIEVSPATTSLPKGNSQELRATGIYSDQTTQDLSQQASWSSDQPDTCSVTPEGLAQALQIGSARLSATLDGVAGQGSVEVTAAVISKLQLDPETLSLPAGRTQQLTALAFFTDGSYLPVTQDTSFVSSSPETVSVSQGESAGLVRARALGQATISASYSGQRASATLTVSPAVLEHLFVEPATVSVPKGLAVSLSASGMYSDGMTRDVTADVLWRSLEASIAEVDAEGRVVGLDQGQVAVEATLSGQQALTTVTVVAPTVSNLEVGPQDLTMLPKGTAQLKALATYSDGSQLEVTGAVNWQSGDSSILEVDTQGLAKARKLGSCPVSATLGVLSASAVVKVERKGTGEGYFSPWSSENAYGDDIELADLDGDGWKDAVSVHSGSNVVTIRFNSGDGFLTRPGNVPLTSHWRLREVDVADVDNDGDIDIVVTEVWGRQLVILKNDGNGTFSNQTRFYVGDGAGYPLELHLADLDGDSDVDILVQDSDESLRLLTYANDGSGRFGPEIVSLHAGGWPSRAQFFDYDGTNGPDMVYVDATAHDVMVSLSAGDGTFLAPRVLLDNINAGCVTVGDWNGDGHTDLGTSNTVSNPDVLKIWLNDGFDGFSAGQQFTGGFANVFAPAHDMDGDGHLDILMFARLQPQTFVFYGRGDGNFEPALELWCEPRNIRAADMNRDGNDDIVSNELTQLFFDDERSSPKVSYLAFRTDSDWFASGDLDGDGDLDFAVLNKADSAANRILLNDGHGRLTQTSTWRAGSNPNFVTAVDLNRDGKLDLVTNDIASGGANMTVLLGLGNGTFPNRTSYPVVTGSRFTTGDFDGDGDIDLASAAQSESLVRLYANNGAGRFTTPPLVFSAGPGPQSLVAVDVDGDADLDLVNFSYTDFRVMLIKNLGSGSFSAPLAINTGYGGITNIATADIDDDGDMDLAVGHGSSNQVTVILKNDGTGVFTVAAALPEQPYSSFVRPVFGDIDGDGDEDLVSTFLRFNDGNGNFGPPTGRRWGERPRVIGDFDGDGDLDIAALVEFKQFWDSVAIWPNSPRPRAGRQ